VASATLVLSEHDPNPLAPNQGCPLVADVVIDAVITIYECNVDNLISPCEYA
jgi:hypothetical protein